MTRPMAWCREAFTIGALAAVAAAWTVTAQTPGPHSIEWRVDNVTSIGGNPVTVIGAPTVVATASGAVVEFDGLDDGLLLHVNPLAGLARFTVEVVFQPAIDGNEEQRFFHAEEMDTGNRALIELRLDRRSGWALDTYLRHGDAGLTLLDRNVAHAAGRWSSAALTFDGVTMRHYVNGALEGEGPVAFKPLGAGTTSLGVRQTRVSWFKGRISRVRITDEALPAGALLRGE